jgi:hypothetical protein
LFEPELFEPGFFRKAHPLQAQRRGQCGRRHQGEYKAQHAPREIVDHNRVINFA